MCRSSEQPADGKQHDDRSWSGASRLAVSGRRRFNSTRSLRRTQETLRRQVRQIRYVGDPIGLRPIIVQICYVPSEKRVRL